MYDSISLRVTLLPHPAFWQVTVSTSTSSVPRCVRAITFDPHPGLTDPS